ncbi:transcriptional regulator, DeoR family [Granulicatella balaenopterae]|uniref:Transcriptional regulator, DeoR family n=1 Tax=Granulicatella balaenopterae TaxID=137733 RepID=A0A1H9LGM2_9LACT|nr:DeoR/GlpR family DNA-binding transcription regulator [Granulicatella balaenopterae]SER10642.1 transcriptional regulator, DeoR family [Granulicatella balaenopterae]
MLTEERQQIILDLLNKQNVVHLHQLCELLNASESTIRRDLSQLDKEGKLTRIHGGAKRKYTVEREFAYHEKTVKNIHSKEEVGKIAASLVEEGDTIFIDAGTTTLKMIPYLKEKKIRVVTNGIHHSLALSEEGINTYLLGGQLKEGTKAIIGPSAQMQLEQYRFRKAFLGMNGVDPEFGYTTPDEDEAMIKRLAIARSSQSFVCVDNTKFGKVSFCKVADIEDCDLVTIELTDGQLAATSEKTMIYQKETK